MKKRIISIVLMLVLIVSVVPVDAFNLTVNALTENEFNNKLNTLRVQYPNYSEWNDYYDGGHQCWGFARLIADSVFGGSWKNWAQVNSISNVKAGDILQYGNTSGSGHTVFVTSVSGDTIYFVDCNGNGNYSGGTKVRSCGIKWDNSISKSGSMFGKYSFSYLLSSPGFGSIPIPGFDDVDDIRFNSVSSSGFSVYWNFANCSQVIVSIKSIAMNREVGSLTLGNGCNYDFAVQDSSWGREFEVRLIPDGNSSRTHYLRYGDKDNLVILPEGTPVVSPVDNISLSDVNSNGFSVSWSFSNCSQVVVVIKSIALGSDVGALTLPNNSGYTFVQQNASWGREYEVRLIPDGDSSRTHYVRYGDKENLLILPGSFTTQDINPPVISNVRIYDLSTTGYTVSCKVTDDRAVDRIVFPTWTVPGDQDDIIWGQGTIEGDTVTYRVNVSEHNNEIGCAYATHIYAYDSSDNESHYNISVKVPTANDTTPPVISNITILNLCKDGYTVSCKVTDNIGISYVQFPTWTTNSDQSGNNQDDITWGEGTINGNTVTYHVNTSEHNNEVGCKYVTHIYAYDYAGNLQTGSITAKVPLKNVWECDHSGSTEIKNKVQSTCTKDGYSGDVYCLTCNGLIQSGNTVPAGHTYESVVTPPTCTEDGYITYTCSVCHDTYTGNTVTKLGHLFDNDCDTTCNRCDYVRTITHKYVPTVTAPTCTADGYTTYTCSVCHDTYTGDTVTKLGHIMKVTTVVATPTERGYDLHECTRPGCGYSYKDNYTDYIPDEPVDPNAPKIVVQNKTVRAGEQFTVDVVLENNPGINTFAFGFDYDDSAFTLDKVECNSVLGGQFYFVKKATWFAGADSSFNGAVLTLTFTAKEDVEIGDYTVKVTYNAGDIGNYNEQDVHFNSVPGTLTVIDYIPGDINGDGVVNPHDLTRLLKYISGDDVTVVEKALDVNGDGNVNPHDLTRLLKYISGDDVEIH